MLTHSTRFWIALNLVRGIGAARMRLLLDFFGDAETAWNAAPTELAAAGLSQRLIESIAETRASDRLDRVQKIIERLNLSVLTWDHAEYPHRLRAIEAPPPVLYCLGACLPVDETAVAIVGTRRAGAYGRQVADELATALARSGVTVVSGLARGIDAVAHAAAIRGGGRTFAVLGSGLDQIYPPEHARLAAEIRQHGALLSDYPPETRPDAANFPPRNRIISGLSAAVVVVEAGEKSGALITANFAQLQGRPIYAVPGSIYAVQSKGANALIRDGSEILTDIPSFLTKLNLDRLNGELTARRSLPVGATEAQILAVLSTDPLHVDDISNLSGLPIQQVTSTIALMELKGLVRPLGAMNYVAVREDAAEYKID